MSFENNSFITTIIEPWFIPLDILMIIGLIFAILLSIIFIFFIIFDKTCHTIPMMLVANSCLSELVFGIVVLSMAIFTLQNDIKQIHYQDSFCIFRGFMGYVGTALQNNSYLLQSLYRYITVVYPARLSWQSAKLQAFLIFLIWTWSFIGPLPYILTNQIKYLVDDQICQMPLGLTFLTVYNALGVYMMPICLTIFIYFKLVRHVKTMSGNVTPVNTLFHAQRELKMVKRIVILVLVVTTVGLTYATFVFISFFTTPPRYHFRIAYLFNDVSMGFVLITLLKFTESLKKSIKKQIDIRKNTVLPINA